jgi:TRAP-type C4-dicarboxylate transport system permease large subunit
MIHLSFWFCNCVLHIIKSIFSRYLYKYVISFTNCVHFKPTNTSALSRCYFWKINFTKLIELRFKNLTHCLMNHAKTIIFITFILCFSFCAIFFLEKWGILGKVLVIHTLILSAAGFDYVENHCLRQARAGSSLDLISTSNWPQ